MHTEAYKTPVVGKLFLKEFKQMYPMWVSKASFRRHEFLNENVDLRRELLSCELQTSRAPEAPTTV